MWKLLSFVLLIAIQAAPPQRELKGTVRLEDGGVPAGVTAVMFPADLKSWSDPKVGETSRLVSVTNGAFVISELPSGLYHLGFTSGAGAKEFPAPALFARLNALNAIPIPPSGNIGIDAVLAPVGTDFRVSTSQMAMSSMMTVPSGRGGLAPPGRGAPPRPVATYSGSITGRVVDAGGRPVAGADVRTLRRRVQNGVVDYLPIGLPEVTDAEGRYRLPNIAAGEYLVLVMPHVFDRASRDLGSVRRAPASAPDASGQTIGYVPTYYPSTPDDREAVMVTVAAGERAGIDVQLARRPVFRVTGVIKGVTVRAVGPPATLAVFPTFAGPMMTANMQRVVALSTDGRFEVNDLPAGEHTFAFAGLDGWAQATVQVEAHVDRPLVLELAPPMRVSGTMEFHGDAPRPSQAPPSPATPISAIMQNRVELAPVVRTPGVENVLYPPGPDGSFRAEGAGPGPFILRATQPAPWIQVSGFVNGIDTLDLPLSYGPSAESALIVMADRPTTIVINVRDASDKPLPNVLVALFSEDERYWVSRSRRAHAGPSSPVGTATFTGLPAGKYFVAVAPELPANAVASAALFRRLVARATRFELALRESRAITVQVK